MKFPRRWRIWALLLVATGVAGFFVLRPQPSAQYVTQTVAREDIVQTVDANGEVMSIDKVELSFGIAGTMESLLARVGDAVVQDDLLAALKTDELIADVQSAYQAARAAQGTLDAQRAGASDEAVDVSLATLEAAQIDYDQSLSLVDLVDALYAAQEDEQATALASATSDVSQTIADNALLIADAYDDLLGAAWAGAIEARTSFAKADEILGIRNTTLNDDYQNLLSAGNAAAVTSAKAAFASLESSLPAAESAVVSARYGASAAIASAAQAVEEAMMDAAGLLLHLRAAVSAMPATGDLSVSEATALATSIDTVRNALQTDRDALQDALQTVQDALNTASANLEDAHNALAQAQAARDAAAAARAYQSTLAAQEVDSALAVRALREAELARVKAAPRTVDLASYEADVARAQAAYSAALARLANAEIRSPIAGHVTDVSVEVGEQVAAAQAVITVQTTQEQFEIIADVNESDIAKLAVGQRAQITLDAFGSSQTLAGAIRKINPAQKLVEGVVFYEVTVSPEPSDTALALRPGLSADLIFTTDRVEEALWVSQRAIQSRDNATFVRVLQDGTAQEREVTIGLRGDLGRVEIVSGLEEGEEVILREVTP